jgi:uroporphyrinogen-III synthase
LAALKSGVDVITLTSSSTVRNFVAVIKSAGMDPLHLPGHPSVACIGPITAQTAREIGYTEVLVAKEYTMEGLLKVIQSIAKEKS